MKDSIPPETLQSILRKISRFGDRQKLCDYLLECVHILSPKEGHETKNIPECVSEFLGRDKNFRLQIRMKGKPSFEEFSSEFFLTEGLHIVAGFTGHGKTHWALEWARHCAYQERKILFLSYEMTFDDIAAREIAYQTGIQFKDVQSLNISDVQSKIIKDIFLEEKQSLLKNIEVLRMSSVNWKDCQAYFFDRFYKAKPSLVIVDYLQMLDHTGIDEDAKHRMFGKMAREFKMIADSHNCAFVICSQINRKATEEIKRIRTDGILYYPMGNESIKESGGIAEAADSVQMICIPDKFENCPDHLKGSFQVIVDKNRKLGTFPKKLFPFNKERMEFL